VRSPLPWRPCPTIESPGSGTGRRLSGSRRDRLDEQIAELQALRDELSDYIGCGCLSLRSCAIFDPSDRASEKGTGPRYLLGDERSAAD
jgi:MerR family redox-sensitive transcriptional activator SoxR